MRAVNDSPSPCIHLQLRLWHSPHCKYLWTLVTPYQHYPHTSLWHYTGTVSTLPTASAAQSSLYPSVLLFLPPHHTTLSTPLTHITSITSSLAGHTTLKDTTQPCSLLLPCPPLTHLPFVLSSYHYHHIQQICYLITHWKYNTENKLATAQLPDNQHD